MQPHQARRVDAKIHMKYYPMVRCNEDYIVVLMDGAEQEFAWISVHEVVVDEKFSSVGMEHSFLKRYALPFDKAVDLVGKTEDSEAAVTKQVQEAMAQDDDNMYWGMGGI